jgi:hypothetical protein
LAVYSPLLATSAANRSLKALLSNFRSNDSVRPPGVRLYAYSEVCRAGGSAGTGKRSLPPCDTVSSMATTTSRGASLAYAQRSLSQLYPDARGDLLGAGYRRIKVVARRSTCGPYKIAGVETGLVTCTTQARVCGR